MANPKKENQKNKAFVLTNNNCSNISLPTNKLVTSMPKYMAANKNESSFST